MQAQTRSELAASMLRRQFTNRLEVLAAAVNLAYPVSPNLSPAPSFMRAVAFVFRAGAGGAVEVLFLISLIMDLQVSAETLLLRKRLATAGPIGACRWVHRARVMLQGRPRWVVCWVYSLRRQAGTVDTSVPFVCGGVRCEDASDAGETNHRASWSVP